VSMMHFHLRSLLVLFLLASVIPVALGLALVRKGHIEVHRRPYARANGRTLLCAGLLLVFACIILDVSATASLLLF
jgi:hypothetical protein